MWAWGQEGETARLVVLWQKHIYASGSASYSDVSPSLKICAQRKAAWRKRVRRIHLSFFSLPRSLAFHQKSLACLSRFALVSVQKRTKAPEEGQLLGSLLLKAFISTFMTCRVSWRHTGHSLNTQIRKRLRKRRKLTRRFDIPQK